MVSVHFPPEPAYAVWLEDETSSPEKSEVADDEGTLKPPRPDGRPTLREYSNTGIRFFYCRIMLTAERIQIPGSLFSTPDTLRDPTASSPSSGSLNPIRNT